MQRSPVWAVHRKLNSLLKETPLRWGFFLLLIAESLDSVLPAEQTSQADDNDPSLPFKPFDFKQRAAKIKRM